MFGKVEKKYSSPKYYLKSSLGNFYIEVESAVWHITDKQITTSGLLKEKFDLSCNDEMVKCVVSGPK